MRKIKIYKEVTVIELARKLGSGEVERGTVMGFRNDSRGDWTDAKIACIIIPSDCPLKACTEEGWTDWTCAALITERYPNEVPEGITPLSHPWLAYVGQGPLPGKSLESVGTELYWASPHSTEWTVGGYGYGWAPNAHCAVDIRTDYARKHYPELVDAMEYREPLVIREGSWYLDARGKVGQAQLSRHPDAPYLINGKLYSVEGRLAWQEAITQCNIVREVKVVEMDGSPVQIQEDTQ